MLGRLTLCNSSAHKTRTPSCIRETLVEKGSLHPNGKFQQKNGSREGLSPPERRVSAEKR